MLSLESTSSRMSNLARQEIYFDRQFGLDETLEGIERVTAEDVSASRATCSRTERWPPRCWATERPGALASELDWGVSGTRTSKLSTSTRSSTSQLTLRSSH